MFAIVVLHKNNNGNYFTDIMIDGERVTAYLSKKVIESGQLFSQVGENLKYLALIHKKDENKDIAYINQILQIPSHIDRLSDFEFVGNYYLTSNGGIIFKLQQQDIAWNLPHSLIKDFIYKIFNNGLVKLTLSLREKSGFAIQNIAMICPKIQSSLFGYISSINKQDNKRYYSARFYPDADDCTAKNIFLPVQLLEKMLHKNGIFEISENAKMHARLTFNHEENKYNLEILHNPENAVHTYNTPRATLIFIKISQTPKQVNKYIFKTQMVNGVSLLVSLWESDLSYYIDEPKNIKPNSKISCKLGFNENQGWIKYGIAQPKKERYDGLFSCYKSKVINGCNHLWFEYAKSPYFRFRISQESFFTHGVYNFLVESSVKLGVEKKDTANAREWIIKSIDKTINPLPLGHTAPISATVISTWTKHDDSPNYIVKVKRSTKSYALENHCMAKVKANDVELLVVIPRQLLVQRGFYQVQAGTVLELEVFTIIYPIFDVAPIKILCANKVKSEPVSSCDKLDGRVLTVECIGERSLQEKEYMQYEFRVVDKDEAIRYNDKKAFLAKIKNIENYWFIIRTSEYKGNLYIKEFISAKLNLR